MAANNYFGFTHGGTQYGAAAAAAAGAAAYQATPAAGYAAVGHTPAAAATYAAQRATTAYEAAAAYQPAAATSYAATASSAPTYDYSYTRVQTYDNAAKTAAFYPQPTSTSFSAAADPAFQAKSSTTYTAGYQNAAARPAGQASKTYNYPAAGAAQSYTYPNQAAAAATANKNYSGYDAALYNAATLYVQQQAHTAPKGAGTWKASRPGVGAAIGQKPKLKQPPKPQQLHYCDVCKISCAGPQTYREHLEGQKHKKKESAQKQTAGTTPNAPRGGNSLRCELCDVTCTGSDAYAAHIRGAKHQKVVKLHTKLGKPIPSTEPVVVPGKSTTTTAKTGAAATTAVTKTTEVTKVVATPKINFVGGTKLTTTTPTASAAAAGTAVKEEPKEAAAAAAAPAAATAAAPAVARDDTVAVAAAALGEKEVEPVGQEYIEEIKNEEGKVVSFNCKLCECRFNDPNAKEMHMKGRRHRLQYKKKVNPELIVEVKPSLRQRKLQEEKLRRQQMREEMWRRREESAMDDEERIYWEERRRYEEEMEYFEWCRRGAGRGMPPFGPMGPMGPRFGPIPPMLRRPDSADDRHVMAKHSEIYPKDEELNAIQKIVSNSEKALKMVSDDIAEADAPKKDDGTATESKDEDGKELPRTLKGVMRVGVLAKGLLLQGDADVQLVVLCAEKPTRTLLERVANLMPKHLATVTPDEKYALKLSVEQASLIITNQTEPQINVTVTLTSPLMRDGAADEPTASKDPPDVLDKQKCLEALAALRHAKWFQARASGVQSCVIVIRIMRELCQRVPTWTPLNTWALELLVERVVASAGFPLAPGDALRRVLEAIASGLLLPGTPGLIDPCEKEPVDTLSGLTAQEREDITASAQHALRLMAFRQVHKILGMDALPPPKFNRGKFNRKRRRDNSCSGENGDSEGGDGKKDKKEDESEAAKADAK
ncbi:zinc finger RNA-binding protein-like isoform X2 [Amphibalanus amphitrite]|uniref:zinc finger RNA-binding protein-like isoform X2 n=1 Tax=Amphibalanus amphitrite TaxID=1232801 RepID=UPI001C8FD43F|nr:zinc finger RNA-binding protein-like isoform X2 [Amphibalanus amphitrite]